MIYLIDSMCHLLIFLKFWQSYQKRSSSTYEGGNIHIGSELYSLFRKARLDVIDYKEELVIQTPETGSDLAWLTNIMLPRIIKSGATTDKILDTGKLEKKLQEEIAQANTGFIRDTNFGICGVINQS